LLLPGGERRTLRTGALKPLASQGRIRPYIFERDRPVQGHGPRRGKRIHSGRAGGPGGCGFCSVGFGVAVVLFIRLRGERCPLLVVAEPPGAEGGPGGFCSMGFGVLFVMFILEGERYASPRFGVSA
jgi:hypothetical protein